MATESPLLDVTTIVDVMRLHAARDPDLPYLTWLADGERVDEELTFGQLAARVDRVAVALAHEGLQPGDRALLLYPQGPDFMVAFLACLAAGVIAVPAYPPRNARHMPRIERILLDADARVIVSVEDTRARIEAWLSNQDGRSTMVLATDTLERDTPPAARATPSIRRDDIAFLQYTSGSTGLPKGVMVTHANMLANLRMSQQTFEYDETSHFVSWLPAYHDMGLIGNLMNPLFLGSRVILMSPAVFLQKPLRWLHAISRFKARTSGAPNFAFDLAAAAVTPEQKADLDLSTLDLLYNGSEPIDANALERFASAFAPCGFRASALFPCYGMAETTLLSTGSKKGQGARTLAADSDALGERRVELGTPQTRNVRTLVSCGFSAAGQELVIAEPDSRRRLPDDRIGEVWLRGPHVAKGYWRQPELTREVFGAMLDDGAGPFLRTGDLGFVHEGELFVTGRIKDVIITRGRNHYPHDIEFTLKSCHPALREEGAVACGVSIRGEERLVIVQEIDRHHHADADAAMRQIRAVVTEEHEVAPYAIVLVRQSTVPRTSSGKKQRGACAQAFLDGSLPVVAEWRETSSEVPLDDGAGTARTQEDIEAFLTSALARTVAMAPESIDVSEPFSTFGLDSLKAMTLLGELERWYGHPVSPTVFYNYPTVASLAAHLAGADANAPIERVQG